jgi:hypothetical protein
MNSRPSVFVLMLRYFLTVFTLTFLISIFWNVLSGMNMFPFKIVIGVSMVLTLLFTGIGWIVVMLGSQVILRDDPEFQEWKAKGGRPYWDSLGWPIKPVPPHDRESD